MMECSTFRIRDLDAQPSRRITLGFVYIPLSCELQVRNENFCLCHGFLCPRHLHDIFKSVLRVQELESIQDIILCLYCS